MSYTPHWPVYFICAVFLVSGCDTGSSDNSDLVQGECNFPVSQVVNGGVGKDGIPSLQNPLLVDENSTEATYLAADDRVIGILINGQAIAVPHNILWWHEILNLDYEGSKIAVSYCPLTGSSITFDRTPHNGVSFGVSGLLWQNNLIMYNRDTRESLWPQMAREAGCGTDVGQRLESVAAAEMTWAGWKLLHPDTRVVSSNTGFLRNYRATGYPYGTYENPDNASTLFQQVVNTDRQPKERVLGIPLGLGAKLYPFFELDTADLLSVVNDIVDGRPVAVFWDDASQGAVAFEAVLGGTPLTFAVQGNQFVDLETLSTWDLQGRAVSGDRAGQQLAMVKDAYVAFWFAWKAFHPQSEVWLSDEIN